MRTPLPEKSAPEKVESVLVMASGRETHSQPHSPYRFFCAGHLLRFHIRSTTSEELFGRQLLHMRDLCLDENTGRARRVRNCHLNHGLLGVTLATLKTKPTS